MEETNDQIKKMTQWVRERYGGGYAENLDLVKQIYAKNNIAKTISDCAEGGKAELELLIAKAYKPYTVKVCSKCWCKICKEQCREEDYIDRTVYSFLAGDDKKGLITIRTPPWFEGDGSQIKEDTIHKVIGKVGREYHGRYDLTVKNIQEVKKLAIA